MIWFSRYTFSPMYASEAAKRLPELSFKDGEGAAKSLADGGKVRPLAIAGPNRIAAWPDVPTMQELGYANFNHSGFVGLAGPAKMSSRIIALLNSALNDAIHTDVFTTRMEALGMTVPEAQRNTPENFAAFMRDESAHQGNLARLTGHDPMAPKQ